MHHHSAALRFYLLRGAGTEVAGRIVAKRDLRTHGKIPVQLNILEASHLVTIDAPGCRFSELLVCRSGLEADNEAAENEAGGRRADFAGLIDSCDPVAHPAQEEMRRSYDLGTLSYEVRIWRTLIEDSTYLDLLQRVRGNNVEGALLHDFKTHQGGPASHDEPTNQTPLTALLFDAETSTLQTAHSYPDEGCVVLSTSHFNLGAHLRRGR